nr:Xaa-Pro peptidase family protein [Bhargavaea massiliensis]
MRLNISKEEILERQSRLVKELQNNGLDGAILFNQTDIFYLSDFNFISTERPICLFIDPLGKTNLFIPALEIDYAGEIAYVDEIYSYPEYPGILHPMEYLKGILTETGFVNKNVGIDGDGYSSPYGYVGPKLSEIIDANFKSIQGWVEKMRYVKSQNEIELIKESCRWGNLAHKLLQKNVKAGLNELEVSSSASHEASLAMINALGREYRPYGQPAHASFRGQIGELSAFPHVVTQNATIKKGDNLVTWAAADVWGYQSELERTMFVEDVSSEQEKYFKLMCEAQETAFKNIKPGIPASAVDKEVQRFIDENGIRQYCPHHTGHAIGLLMHEAPFFDLGDHTILEPGMVFTVEPGVFVKGLGGFRHSDTVLVTEEGVELLTYYPRDLESLICY